MTHVFYNAGVEHVDTNKGGGRGQCCSNSWNTAAFILFFIAIALMSASSNSSAEDGQAFALAACAIFIVVFSLRFCAPQSESGDYCETTACSCRLKPFATASGIFGFITFGLYLR